MTSLWCFHFLSLTDACLNLGEWRALKQRSDSWKIVRLSWMRNRLNGCHGGRMPTWNSTTATWVSRKKLWKVLLFAHRCRVRSHQRRKVARITSAERMNVNESINWYFAWLPLAAEAKRSENIANVIELCLWRFVSKYELRIIDQLIK